LLVEDHRTRRSRCPQSKIDASAARPALRTVRRFSKSRRASKKRMIRAACPSVGVGLEPEPSSIDCQVSELLSAERERNGRIVTHAEFAERPGTILPLVHYLGSGQWGSGLSVIHAWHKTGNGEPMIAVVAYGTIVALFLCWWLLGSLQRVSRPRPAKEARSSPTTMPFVAVAKSYTRQEQNASKPSSAR
jgi:hypothetical protein